MVYIDGQKFACEKCIKGHRASTCNHHDRSLIPIRRKGRPVSQCATCRELRKTRKLHVKCVCLNKNDYQPVHKKPRSERNSVTAPKGGIQSLLNPCRCSQASFCICCRPMFDKVFQSSTRHHKSSTLASSPSTHSTPFQSRTASLSPGASTAIPDPDAFLHQIRQTAGHTSSKIEPDMLSASPQLMPNGSSCCSSRRSKSLDHSPLLLSYPGVADSTGSPRRQSAPTANQQLPVTSAHGTNSNAAAGGGGCQLTVNGSCGCGCDCGQQLSHLLKLYPSPDDLKRILTEKYGYPGPPPPPVPIQPMPSGNSCCTSASSAGSPSLRASQSPRLTSPASSTVALQGSTHPENWATATDSTLLPTAQPSVSTRGNAGSLPLAAAPTCCRSTTCRCTSGCQGCGCSQAKPRYPESSTALPPVSSLASFPRLQPRQLSPSISLSSPPPATTLTLTPAHAVPTSDSLWRPSNIQPQPSWYLDRDGAPTCACGCQKPHGECTNCIQALCEEQLLKPPAC
ncbi:copper-binding transcription factor [Dimargaris verticillata]|uniref:Copper-binding transcription factor n=1 Tax=Dimargaris verticillata TaxID=2761393 RepID=A0A9W8EAU9_9FUNG|nr:copper-binding transcription factor [Dimargaris verticillata]